MTHCPMESQRSPVTYSDVGIRMSQRQVFVAELVITGSPRFEGIVGLLDAMDDCDQTVMVMGPCRPRFVPGTKEMPATTRSFANSVIKTDVHCA